MIESKAPKNIPGQTLHQQPVVQNPLHQRLNGFGYPAPLPVVDATPQQQQQMQEAFARAMKPVQNRWQP